MSFFLFFVAPLVLLVCVSGLTEKQVVDVSILMFPDILKEKGRTGQMWIPKYWTVESGVGTVNGLAILAKIPFQASLTTLEIHTDFIFNRYGDPVPVTSHLMSQLFTSTGRHEIVAPKGWTKFEQDWGLLSEDGKVEGSDELLRREKSGNNSSSIKAESSLVVIACILLLALV